MSNDQTPNQIHDDELDDVSGGGFLEPVITRKPLSGLVGYREEFGVERPKPGNLDAQSITLK